MKKLIEAAWYRPELPPLALRPLAVAYRVISERLAARRRAASVKLPVPVIVVGNIAVGGTGKTPVTLWLIEVLKQRGYRPGVLSRGYGGQGPFPCDVAADNSPVQCGDEPILIAARAAVPVVVAPDRIAAGRHLLRQHPDVDVLVCDDGLQHYRLARDLEICVIDGVRGLGNGCLLPAGPLREPPARMQDVGLILVNGGASESYGGNAARFDLVINDAFSLAGAERRTLESFKGTAVHAVAGIGNPARFFSGLSACGLEIIEQAFPDHHAFSPQDFAAFGDTPVLMTEKDAVKCRRFARASWWRVPAQFKPSGEAEARLEMLLAGLPHGR